MRTKRAPGITANTALKWLLLVVVVLALVKFVPWSGLRGTLHAQMPGSAPHLTILNVECFPDPGMPRAEVLLELLNLAERHELMQGQIDQIRDRAH